jgi:uncharacterized protein DUF4055
VPAREWRAAEHGRAASGRPWWTTRQNETAEAVRLRHAGEFATLRSLAAAVGTALADALRWSAWWAGADEAAVAVQMNTDFVESPLDAAQAQALLAMWQAGSIAWPTLYALYEKGELTRPGVTAGQERALIEGEAAMPGAMPAPLDGDAA